ncbi:MAG: DUF3459 domain-containing protein, partial [Nocardioidaceae bacterium]
LALRAEAAVPAGEAIELLDTRRGSLAFRRGDVLVCVINCGATPAPLPPQADALLIASSADPLVGAGPTRQPTRQLAPDTAAWFRLAPSSR